LKKDRLVSRPGLELSQKNRQVNSKLLLDAIPVAQVDIEFPLEAWAGKKASFWLEVDALNPSASRDWACWVSAQILR
jgi:hypothetical protein